MMISSHEPPLQNPKTDQETVAMPLLFEDVHIAGFNMSRLTHTWRLVVCVVGIFVLYICYGALQEIIFSANDMRQHSPFLTLYQFAIYLTMAYFELNGWSTPKARSFTAMYVLLAFLTLGTIVFSNASVGFLNYPTQVIFKCCKMIPVLMGGVLIQGKKYSYIEILAVILMTLGLVFFTLVDVSIQPSFTIFGVLLVSTALCCDGALGNFQELVMKKHGRSNTEILFYSYAIGFCILLFVLILWGSLWQSIIFFNEHPIQTYGYGFLFSITGYFGVQFVLCLVHFHGALMAVTVTTFRKAVSIILSFVLFKKPFSQGYLWSGLLVIAGIYLNLYHKNRLAWNNYLQDLFHRLYTRKLHSTSSSSLLPL